MNIDMINAAAQRLDGHVRRTPLLSSPFLDDIAGRRVFVKAECLQHTGSFKFRGAWSALSAMDPETRSRGVIAFSSGNHAQGVALAARAHGTSAVIVMPEDAPKMKIENTRALGGEVVLYDRETEDRDEIGGALAQERGLTLIKPFDEPLVIAGQGMYNGFTYFHMRIACKKHSRCIQTWLRPVLKGCGAGKWGLG